MFTALTDLIEATGALGVALVMFLENVFPPIPSELIMPLAGFLAASGRMSLWAVWIAGTIGALAGAWLWYLLGQRLGKRGFLDWIDRNGHWLTLDRDGVNRAFAWFDRHDGAAVFWGRMIPGVRTLISVPAGMAGMPQWRFGLYSALGSGLWNALLIAGGYLLEANYRRVAAYLDPVTTALLVLVVVTYLWRLWQRRKRG